MKKIIALTAMTLVFTGFSAFAADKAPAKKDSEAREKMAAAHEKMATCLRSDKSIEDCHTDMHKQCKESMGAEGCPMMGKMGKGMHGKKSCEDHEGHEDHEKK